MAGFTAIPNGGGFTVGSIAPSTSTLSGVLGGLATTLGGALAARIQGGVPVPAPTLGMSNLRAGTRQDVIRTNVVGQAGVAMPAACGCKPRPGTCNTPATIPADFVGPDFLGIGNGCGDPCYPIVRYRRNTGEQYCAPIPKRRSMNPLNPQAARRATRRLSSMNKQMKRVQKTLRALAR